MADDKKSETTWKDARESLPVRVEKWLTTTGYPLEYRATGVLQDAGFKTMQGFNVEGDHPTNALEIDVIGTTGVFDNGDKAPLIFSLIVECKRIIAPAAWVAMQGGKAERWKPTGILRTPFAADMERQRHDLLANIEPEIVQVPAHALKTLRDQPKDEEKDTEATFKAIQNLLTRALAHNWYPNTKTAALVNDKRTIMTIPVLVVDGELAAARWNPATAKFEVHEVSHVWLDWSGHARWPLPVAQIAVVHIDALPEFSFRMKQWSERWVTGMQRAVDEHFRTQEAVALAHEMAGVSRE